jgi:uncharacterized protein
VDQALVGFVRALRAAGADASPAETIDAARAMALVGYADRQALKLSLGLVLAKTADEKLIHDQVFDLFFAPPQGQAAAGKTGQHAAAEARAQGSHPPAAPRPAAPATGDAGLDHLLALSAGADGGYPSQAMALPLALARAAQAAGVDDIRFATQSAYYTARMLEALPIAPLDDRLSALLLAPEGSPTASTQAELAELQAARQRLQQAARAWVAQRFALYGQGATDAFMNEVVVNRPLGRMSPPDMARMKQVVARMARRLAVRHSRRRRIKLRGQLDLRRTLRASAGHDGVPVTLRFKHRRRDKPRIVAVCDVSGSVAAHVRFLLLFLYALHDTVTDLRCFAFSDRLKDVGEALAQLPFDDAMAAILDDLGHGATDYGRALHDLLELHGDEIDGRTTVLILGDGRSNHANPRLDLLAQLAERAKRVVWLNPEPPLRWGSGDSCMLQYRPFCTQVRHSASAADLERAIDDTLAAYG